MAEINNNLPKYVINNTERTIDTKNIQPENTRKKDIDIKSGEPKKTKYIPDTGVLGRSQIKNSKGADATRSVDEAITLCEKYPQIAECGDDFFDVLYEQFIADGMEPIEAYTKASMAMEEFVEIGKAQLAKNLD